MVPTANPFKGAVNRRRVLQGIGAAGLASVAGCLGDDDGGGDFDPVQDRVTVDSDDIVEGGTFRVGLTSAPDSFDWFWSSSAYASQLHNLLYESLISTDASGEIYNWIAQDRETVDVQDVGVDDYRSYMSSVDLDEDGFVVADEQVVIADPDNEAGDSEGQALLPEDALEAARDGTYGMHIQFDLHEEVEFRNGEQLTAQNVAASYQRLEGSLIAGQIFNSLLSYDAADDYTFDLYVQEPDADAVRELAGVPIYPDETVDAEFGAIGPNQSVDAIGSGPWTVSEHEEAEYTIFERYDDYWFDTEYKDWDVDGDFPNGPVVDEVDVTYIEDDSTRNAALSNGEIDMTEGLSTDNLTNYREDDGYRAAATHGAGYNFIQQPVNVEPFTDKRVRQAFNHLIDREQIAEGILNGWEEPAWVPLPRVAQDEGTTDYESMVEDLREYNEYDPERADELVEEAMEENDFETPIEVTLYVSGGSTDGVAIAELVGEALDAESEYFEANVETEDFLQLVTQLQGPDWWETGDMAFIGLSGGFGPHGYARSLHHIDNWQACCNFQRIDDEELNEMMRDARYGVDVVEDADLRRERYEEIWEYLLDLSANSYGTHSMTVGVVNDEAVHGFNTYPSTQDIIGYSLYRPMDEQITYVDR